MNPGGGSKGGYGEPQPAGYGQPISPPPAYGQQAPSYGQHAPSYTYGNPDTMPVSSQPQHTAITVVQAPLVMTWKHSQKFGKDNRNTSQQFGREPMETFCPRCQRNVRTTTIKKTSQTAYLYAIILCLCWWVHGYKKYKKTYLTHGKFQLLSGLHPMLHGLLQKCWAFLSQLWCPVGYLQGITNYNGTFLEENCKKELNLFTQI